MSTRPNAQWAAAAPAQACPADHRMPEDPVCDGRAHSERGASWCCISFLTRPIGLLPPPHLPGRSTTKQGAAQHVTRSAPSDQRSGLAALQVWAVRVDVHVLDNCGNMADAAALSALGALLAFRRPDVTVGPGETGDVQAVTVHSPDVREPVPLSIHHLPLAVTFAFFGVRSSVTWRSGLQSPLCVRCLAASDCAAACHPDCLAWQQAQCVAGGSLGKAALCWMWLTPGHPWQGQLPEAEPVQLPQGEPGQLPQGGCSTLQAAPLQ